MLNKNEFIVTLQYFILVITFSGKSQSLPATSNVVNIETKGNYSLLDETIRSTLHQTSPNQFVPVKSENSRAISSILPISNKLAQLREDLIKNSDCKYQINKIINYYIPFIPLRPTLPPIDDKPSLESKILVNLIDNVSNKHRNQDEPLRDTDKEKIDTGFLEKSLLKNVYNQHNLTKIQYGDSKTLFTPHQIIVLFQIGLLANWRDFKASDCGQKLGHYWNTHKPHSQHLANTSTPHPNITDESSLQPALLKSAIEGLPEDTRSFQKETVENTNSKRESKHLNSSGKFLLNTFIYQQDNKDLEQSTDPSSRLWMSLEGFGDKELQFDESYGNIYINDENNEGYNLEGSEIIEPTFIVPKTLEDESKVTPPSTNPVKTYGVTINDGKVLRKEIRRDNGEFVSRYSSADGTSSSDSGILVPSKDGGQALVRKGSYSFTSPEGLRFRVDFRADETGYHAMQVPVTE